MPVPTRRRLAWASLRSRPSRIPAGRVVRLHTGRGADTARHRYWQRTRGAWSNASGRAMLHAPGGRVADRCRYAGVGRFHAC